MEREREKGMESNSMEVSGIYFIVAVPTGG
jgi:hypothetical protein